MLCQNDKPKRNKKEEDATCRVVAQIRTFCSPSQRRARDCLKKKIVPKPIIEQVEEEYETSEISFKFEKCALTDTSVGMFRNYQFKRKSKTLISKLTAVWWNESSLENPLKKRGTIEQVNCVELL